MPRFSSITLRIVSLHFLAVFLASLLVPAAIYFRLRETVDDLHNRALLEQATEIADHLSAGAEDQLRLDLPPRLVRLYSENYGRYSYAILDERARVLFSSAAGGAPVFRTELSGDSVLYVRFRREQAELYGVAMPVETAGRKLWIEVAQDLAHRDVLIDDVVANFFTNVGWIPALILLAVLIADIIIVRRGMRPVLQASELATRIGPTATDIRLPEAGMPREIRPLVHAVNEALERLEHGFTSQREFTADAAHELRTPLAVLRAHVDTIGDRALADSLRQDIAVMGRLVDQLLEVAELDMLVVREGEAADLRAVCVEIAAFVAPLAVAQDKTIAVTGTPAPVWVHGNAYALSQAVRNLVDNALVHTRVGSTVEVRVTEDAGSGPAVHVLDEGPGVPEHERALVFRRFWRRDRRRSGSAGLGLSIVSRIVEAHRGSVRVGNRAGGGAVFSIALERAPAPVLRSEAA